MSKVFGELMILGFIGLGIKALKEIAHLNAYSKPMITFQAADIMVFVLAIALIIQATSIFMNLRSKNIQAAKAELISSVHLVDMIKEEQQKKKTFASRLCSLLPANYFYRVRRIDKPQSNRATTHRSLRRVSCDTSSSRLGHMANMDPVDLDTGRSCVANTSAGPQSPPCHGFLRQQSSWLCFTPM